MAQFKPPTFAVIIQRAVQTICHRRIGTVVKIHSQGGLNFVLAKVYDDYMVLEGSTGLLLKKAPNVKQGMQLLEVQDPKRVRQRIASLPEIMNSFKRRCYEFA